jgi:TolA-binding protein
MIHGETQVTFTMKQLLGVIVIGGGVLWAVLAFTITGMRDDVSAIRTSIQGLQTADKEGAVRIREGETKLIEQIGGLRTQITGLSGKLDSVTGTVSTLTAQIIDVQKRLAARQAAWDDPKSTAAFASYLTDAIKQQGVDKTNVFLVPIGTGWTTLEKK